MALTFNGASSKLTGANIVTGYPVSMFCWIRPASLTASQMVMGAGDNGGATELAMFASGDLAGDPLRAFERNTAGQSSSASSAVGMASATWQPCLVVFRSSTSRSVYFDTDAMVTSNESRTATFANFDRTVIGCRPISDTLWANMDIAHAAIWSYAMQDDDWIALKYGVVPDQVQPQALLDYWSLDTQAATQTGAKGTVLTASNTSQASTSPTMNQAIPDSEPARYDGSWVWFSYPNAVHYNGATYFGWTSRNGSTGISKFVHSTKVRSYFVLSSQLEVDDHDNPSIYIRPDGKILVFYGKHNDSLGRRGRISTNAEDITAWGSEFYVGAESTSAYNNIQYLSGNDRLYMHFRGQISGTDRPQYLAYSDDDGATWSTPAKVFYQGTERPYVKSISNGVDRIDFYLTQSHPTELISNLYHCIAKLDVGTLKYYKSDGTTELTLPISINATLDKIYDSGGTVAGWQWDAKYDSNGYPRVLFVKLISSSDIRYMFTRWNGAAWTTPVEITGAGAVIATGTQYAPGICFDADDVNKVYLGVESSGTSEMQEWATADSGATWSKTRDITTSSGASIDNMRPVAPKGAAQGMKLLWWKGTYTADNDYALNAMWEAGDAPIELVGDASSSSVGTGSLTTSIEISGAAASVSTATGAVTTSINLAGSSASVSVADGALTTEIRLSGAALAEATATAVFAGGAAALSGDAAALAAAAGALTTAIQLSGDAVALAIADAGLTTGSGLAGAALSSSSASGVITTEIPLIGAATATASAAGGLNAPIELDGSGASVSNATGDLTVSIVLSGVSLATAIASGALTTQILLNAAAISQAVASATFYVPAVLAAARTRYRNTSTASRSNRQSATRPRNLN